jgi:hypothetical protein
MRFRIQMNTAATDAKLGTGSGERATRIYVTRIDQLVPYMIANKGALVSDNAIGKVKIDDDGTMSISGELGTGTNGSKVSINRPDKWTPGIEYDFGDGLYGIRKQGTITQGVLEANLISIVDNIGTAKLISSGGSVDRGDGICPAANGSLLSFRSGIFYQTPGIGMYSVSDWARTNAPYDVWVTYSK